jgi:imidazolonepropionase-like amidohydrolase
MMMPPNGKYLLSVALLLAFVQPMPAQQADLAITGATLIDGTGGPPEEATTILIREGQITAVMPDGDALVPEGARVIDAAGTYVIPGLADMHVHLGSGGLEPQEATTLDRILRQFLYYGVTTVFTVGGTGGDAPSIEALRSRVISGDALAPHVYATGSMLTLPGSHPVATIMRVPPGVDPATYDWTTRGVALVETLPEARAVVREHAAADMDGIKIVVESGLDGGDDLPQMPPEMIAAVVDEASSLGLPVVAHVSSVDEMEDAVEGGVRALVHAPGNPFPGPEHWTEMREQDVFLVPTLSVYAPMISDRWTRPDAMDDPFLRAGVASHTLESLDSWRSPMAATPDDVRAGLWSQVLASIAAAREAGVPIALGTDTNNPFVFPGYSVHVELELLVEAGLTPMDALVAATRRPAEMLGKEDVFGTLEAGKRADLLILAANPLEDIRNTRRLETVVRSGEVIDRSSVLPQD